MPLLCLKGWLASDHSMLHVAAPFSRSQRLQKQSRTRSSSYSRSNKPIPTQTSSRFTSIRLYALARLNFQHPERLLPTRMAACLACHVPSTSLGTCVLLKRKTFADSSRELPYPSKGIQLRTSSCSSLVSSHRQADDWVEQSEEWMQHRTKHVSLDRTRARWKVGKGGVSTRAS